MSRSCAGPSRSSWTARIRPISSRRFPASARRGRFAMVQRARAGRTGRRPRSRQRSLARSRSSNRSAWPSKTLPRRRRLWPGEGSQGRALDRVVTLAFPHPDAETNRKLHWQPSSVRDRMKWPARKRQVSRHLLRAAHGHQRETLRRHRSEARPVGRVSIIVGIIIGVGIFETPPRVFKKAPRSTGRHQSQQPHATTT